MTIGAIASAIAGAYYLYGSKDGVAKRKEIATWAIKMKGEVLEGIEKLKVISEPAYKEVVKKIAEKYKKVEGSELKKVVDDLHSTWNKMKSEVQTEITKKAVQIKKEKTKPATKKAPQKTNKAKVVKKIA